MAGGDTYRKIFFRNWRNADRFKPNSTPPRQKFNGFVEFLFNPVALSGISDSNTFRTQISSLVQSAKLPEILFDTVIKKQYNIKRVVQTGFDIKPLDISVIDTVNNEWLTVFMKYFSYHYNQPRNRTTEGFGNDRDPFVIPWPSNSETTTKSSAFMTGSFESNIAGLDISSEAHLIDQIKIITYAGGKGVEYICFRPTITSFSLDEINYSDSGFRTFDMSFELENFTINSKTNFTMTPEDLARFEKSEIAFTFDGEDVNDKNGLGYTSRNLRFMGDSSNPRWRAGQ